MSAQKYTFGDVVKATPTGQIGTVKAVHHSDSHYTYQVQLNTEPAEQVELPEADLELVSLANQDETGLTFDRYIT
jgi:hypothetical protein